jgi:hypothetical protein
LTTDTASAVKAAGSYTLYSTVQFNETGADSVTRSRLNTTLRVNLTTDRGVEQATRSTGRGNRSRAIRTTVYTADNTTFWRLNTGQATRYGSGTTAPETPATVSAVDTDNFTQNYTGLTGGFDWERNGTATVDDVTAARYTIDGVADTDVLRADSNQTLSNVTGTLFVDRNGAVRRSDLEYTIVGANSTATVSLSTTLTNVGSTTVVEPDWVMEAS